MKKLYVVRLSEEERSELTKLLKTGRAPAYRRRHAEILLQADQGQHGPALHDRQIIEKLDVARQTVEKVRKRCVEEGLEEALGRRQRSRDRAPVLDGEGEAQLVAIACGEPPDGRARWTLHLLADELKRRKIVHTISHETVRKVLKKTTSSRGANRCGAFRPSRTPPSCAPWNRSQGCTPARMMRPTR